MLENPLHSNEEINKIKNETLRDADTFGLKSRFGYFSIPYPATVGDRFYAMKSLPPARDERGKVILHPRNMVMRVPKSGQGVDVFFQNPFKTDADFVKRLASQSKKEREDYISNIQKQKHNKDKGFKINFKPSGPQEFKDFLTINPYVNKESLYKEQPKHYHVDKEKHKVIIENKNMTVQFPKKGTSSFPGICFSYPKSEKYPKKRPKTVNVIKRTEKGFQPFKPANTALNGFFFNDKKQFAYPDSMLKDFQSIRERAKTAGGTKYKRPKKDFYVSHITNFKPASNMKNGENGYFSKRYGVPFVPFIAKKRAETSKEKKRELVSM